MKTARFVTAWESSIRIIMILSIVVALQTVGLGLLGAKLYRHRERVVVMPPLALQEGRRMEIAWESANQEYAKSFAMYVATLIGNITPENVTFVADSISTYFSPTIYSDVRARILSLAKDEVWSTSTQASYFAPRQVIYEEGTNRVFVVGDIIITGYGKLSERRPVIYEMIVKIRDGRPLVDHFTSYEGTQPRTVKWLLNQPEDVKAKYQWLIRKAQGKEEGK